MNKVQITLYTTTSGEAIEGLLREALDEACIEYGNLQAVANQHPLALAEVANYQVGIKGIAKTEANSCQLRYLGGSWVITDQAGDIVRHHIEQVIDYINAHQLYITNEQIMTPEYGNRLWYKRKA